jgi:hypothetical protein
MDIGIAYGFIGGIIVCIVLNSLTQLLVLFKLIGTNDDVRRFI